MQNSVRDCKFISIGLLGQKHWHIFKFAFFGQSSVRNYELLEISIFCQKHKENKLWQIILTVWPKACGKKRRASVNLHKGIYLPANKNVYVT